MNAVLRLLIVYLFRITAASSQALPHDTMKAPVPSPGQSSAQASPSILFALALCSVVMAGGCIAKFCVGSAEMQHDEAAKRRLVKNMIFAELFLKEFAYTSIISTSYPIVEQFNSGGGFFSGLLIGAPKFMGVIGALMSDWFSGWSLRSRILLSPLLRFLSTGLFAFVSMFPGAFSSVNIPLELLLGARLLDGLGSGIAAPAMRTVLVVTSETEDEQDKAQMDRVYYESFGMGCGPLVGSLLMDLLAFVSGTTTNAAPSIMACASSLAISMFIVGRFPVDIKPAERLSTIFKGRQAQGGKNFFAPIMRCLFLLSLLNYCMSNLESGTAFILQEEYGWRAENVGILVSATFLTCIPFRWFSQYLISDELGRVAFIGGSLRPMALFAFLLHPICQQTISDIVPKHVRAFSTISLLMIADLGMFPMLYTNFGMCTSFSVRLAGRDNSGAWDLAYISKVQSVLSNFGKCLGPPFSRFVIETSGRAAYSMSLVACASSAVLAYEISVCPALRNLIDGQKGSGIPDRELRVLLKSPDEQSSNLEEDTSSENP
jgi:hypothetical protein